MTTFNHQQCLMPYMLSICTPDAVVVSTTSAHLIWLGRNREGVIGHRCSEWASEQSWHLNWRLFQQSLSTGMPLAWDRTVRRLDGTFVQGHVMVRPIRTKRHGLLMLCANSVAADAASGLNVDIPASLADMAHIAPLDELQLSFEELVSHAADMASAAYGQMH